MSDDQLDDLKQFIDSRVSQSEQLIRDDIKTELTIVRQEMSDGFAGVGEAIEEVHKIVDANKTEVDQRLTKLEPQNI